MNIVVAVEVASGARSKGYRCGSGTRTERDRDADKWFDMVYEQLRITGTHDAEVVMLCDEVEAKRRFVA